ncbi:MAG: LysE family translocator [Gammaproteobacteria bacterium]|nr:LysE family translocator [Gammaproteobacteria bacterium]
MPVDPSTLLAYVLTVGAIVLSPGPDTLLILRYTIGSGHRVGLATVAGVQVGLAGHTLLAVLGVSAVIAASPTLFKGLAVAGALYLAWIGLQGFRGQALRFEGAPRVNARRALHDAMLCNLLNPKVIVLFIALLPNFVDPGRDDVTTQLLFLALVLVAINVAWQAPLAWIAGSVRRWLSRPRVQFAVNAGTGTILLGFAVLMLWDHVLRS